MQRFIAHNCDRREGGKLTGKQLRITFNKQHSSQTFSNIQNTQPGAGGMSGVRAGRGKGRGRTEWREGRRTLINKFKSTAPGQERCIACKYKPRTRMQNEKRYN